MGERLVFAVVAATLLGSGESPPFPEASFEFPRESTWALVRGWRCHYRVVEATVTFTRGNKVRIGHPSGRMANPSDTPAPRSPQAH